MELKRCIFFLCTFQRIILKFSRLIVPPILLSRLIRGRTHVRSGFGSSSKLGKRWRDSAIPRRANDRKLERRGASFPVATFSYHFPCVLLSCVHRLGVVDPAQPEADCGHSKRQRERDWRRREPTVEQRSLCRSSTVLSPPRPTLHAPLLPSSPCLRACACVCVFSAYVVYTLKHHSGRQLKLAREYSGVKKFGNGDRTDLSDRRLPV